MSMSKNGLFNLLSHFPPNSCSISHPAGGTCQKFTTKYQDWVDPVSFNLLTSKFISFRLPSAVVKVVEVAVNVADSREGLISLSHSPGAATELGKIAIFDLDLSRSFGWSRSPSLILDLWSRSYPNWSFYVKINWLYHNAYKSPFFHGFRNSLLQSPSKMLILGCINSSPGQKQTGCGIM